jgi:hypothetical protein
MSYITFASKKGVEHLCCSASNVVENRFLPAAAKRCALSKLPKNSVKGILKSTAVLGSSFKA